MTRNKLCGEALIVEDLSCAIRKQRILDGVSFTVKPGEIVLLSGRSGVGKSVLLSLISGHRKRREGEEGRIRYGEVSLDCLEQNERVRYVSLVAQNPRLSFCMRNLRQEMVFCLENIGSDSDGIASRLAQAAREDRVTELLDRPFDTLSGGELQRASFACAKLLAPRCFLLDEPFSNLDEASVSELQKDIRGLAQQGHGILVVDHRLDLWSFVDRILLLGATGRILHRVEQPETLSEADRFVLRREGLIPGEEDGALRESPLAPSAACRTGGAGSVGASKVPEEEAVLTLRRFGLSIGGTDGLLRKGKREPGRVLFENVDLSLYPGECIALVGASGSGKSSFFYALLGQLAYSGSLQLMGKEVRRLRKKAIFQEIGLVFQDPSFQFLKSDVFSELKLSYTAWRIPKSEAEIRQILDRYAFGDSVKKSPWILSQGQQRRLAVLSMTAGKQAVLLVDEPTYGQDYAHARQVMEQLRSLTREAGICCIFTSHDARLVACYADRVFLVRDRRIRDLDPQAFRAERTRGEGLDD